MRIIDQIVGHMARKELERIEETGILDKGMREQLEDMEREEDE